MHIYRLVSENTIEENILRKSDQKRQLDWLAIQSGGFTTDFLQKLNPKDLINAAGTAEGAAAALAGAASTSAAAAAPAAPAAVPHAGGGGGGRGNGGMTAKELQAALRNAEDEADAIAAAAVEQEAEADMAEFTAEPPPPAEGDADADDGEGEGGGGAGAGGRDGSPDGGGGGGALDVAELQEGAERLAAAAGGGGGGVLEKLAKLQSGLRPIEAYAVRLLEELTPQGDVEAAVSKAMEGVVEEQLQVDEMVRRKEQWEADNDDASDDTGAIVPDWDKQEANAAFRSYQQEVAKRVAAVGGELMLLPRRRQASGDGAESDEVVVDPLTGRPLPRGGGGGLDYYAPDEVTSPTTLKLQKKLAKLARLHAGGSGSGTGGGGGRGFGRGGGRGGKRGGGGALVGGRGAGGIKQEPGGPPYYYELGADDSSGTAYTGYGLPGGRGSGSGANYPSTMMRGGGGRGHRGGGGRGGRSGGMGRTMAVADLHGAAGPGYSQPHHPGGRGGGVATQRPAQPGKLVPAALKRADSLAEGEGSSWLLPQAAVAAAAESSAAAAAAGGVAAGQQQQPWPQKWDMPLARAVGTQLALLSAALAPAAGGVAPPSALGTLSASAWAAVAAAVAPGGGVTPEACESRYCDLLACLVCAEGRSAAGREALVAPIAHRIASVLAQLGAPERATLMAALAAPTLAAPGQSAPASVQVRTAVTALLNTISSKADVTKLRAPAPPALGKQLQATLTLQQAQVLVQQIVSQVEARDKQLQQEQQRAAKAPGAAGTKRKADALSGGGGGGSGNGASNTTATPAAGNGVLASPGGGSGAGDGKRLRQQTSGGVTPASVGGMPAAAAHGFNAAGDPFPPMTTLPAGAAASGGVLARTPGLLPAAPSSAGLATGGNVLSPSGAARPVSAPYGGAAPAAATRPSAMVPPNGGLTQEQLQAFQAALLQGHSFPAALAIVTGARLPSALPVAPYSGVQTQPQQLQPLQPAGMAPSVGMLLPPPAALPPANNAAVAASPSVAEAAAAAAALPPTMSPALQQQTFLAMQAAGLLNPTALSPAAMVQAILASRNAAAAAQQAHLPMQAAAAGGAAAPTAAAAAAGPTSQQQPAAFSVAATTAAPAAAIAAPLPQQPPQQGSS